ncbi:phosphatase PAP2 family protein [Bordetella sp. 15P40C-2]|uniref:phosphatase PAP2 family protein n=1 Tax=Bordetella sp. 15P40C-2 TaxID=2572246 RepID=UPI0013282265|nr:phosphatase PAP2 family protein [Bordetella sp. 15P40C-2]MVW70865.1 phosphatase PAP2 family protein [Bordetella sp. 15P40C-2]
MTSPQDLLPDPTPQASAGASAVPDTASVPLATDTPIAPRPYGGAVLVACLALALLMMSRWIDQPLTLAIQQHVSDGVNKVFDKIGNLGDSEFYILAALAVYVVSLIGLRRGWACPLRAGFDRMARGAVLVVGSMAVGGLITLVLKKVVARTRPEVLIEDGWHGLVAPFTRGNDYNSFPSSHTLTAFAVAAAIGEIAPRWRIPALLIAALVAISRVINRDHYLSDVTAAAAIGILVAHYLAPYVLDSSRRWMILPRGRR